MACHRIHRRLTAKSGVGFAHGQIIVLGSPAMDLNGISAIVTGGASGIGEAAARQLAKRGAKVVIADLQDDKGNALASELGGAFAHVDVTSTEDVTAAIELAKEMGPVRALVNSAGVGWATRTIGKDGQYSSAHDLEVFRKVVEVNLIGTFNCIRLTATAMSQTEPPRGRRARRHREHGVGRRVRRADRPGVVLRFEGWRRRA